MRNFGSSLGAISGGVFCLALTGWIGACASTGAVGRPTPVAAKALRQSERISGSYQASFTTRSGMSRKGTLKISPIGNLLFWLEWRGAGSSYSGRGALAGDALLAVWGSPQSLCLAAMLDVGEDGRLHGIWFRAEDREGVAQKLEVVPTQRAGGGLAGVYRVISEDQGDPADPGPRFPHALQVSRLAGDEYRFLWQGQEELEGFGRLNDGTILVVASVVGSGDECRISEMKLADDGSLSWKWLAKGGSPSQ